MIAKENFIAILSSYIKDFEFVNVKPVLYEKTGGMGPDKNEILSHVHHRFIEFAKFLQTDAREMDYPPILSAFSFLQGSLWAVGFYSYNKILDDLDSIEVNPTIESIFDLPDED